MVKPIKQTATATAIHVPVRWTDRAWSVRIHVLPNPMTSFSLPAVLLLHRLKNAVVRGRRRSVVDRCRPWRRARGRFAGECARLAGTAVSLPARRKREQAPRTLLPSGTSRTHTVVREPRLGRALAGRRGELLVMAALPLGGTPASDLSIRHVFENTASYSL